MPVLSAYIRHLWTLPNASRRKRVGVEPTWDRLAAPPGFEVRTPHRGTLLFHINCSNDLIQAQVRTKLHRPPVRATSWPHVLSAAR
jgi:hypothetical protein